MLKHWVIYYKLKITSFVIPHAINSLKRRLGDKNVVNFTTVCLLVFFDQTVVIV